MNKKTKQGLGGEPSKIPPTGRHPLYPPVSDLVPQTWCISIMVWKREQSEGMDVAGSRWVQMTRVPAGNTLRIVSLKPRCIGALGPGHTTGTRRDVGAIPVRVFKPPNKTYKDAIDRE